MREYGSQTVAACVEKLGKAGPFDTSERTKPSDFLTIKKSLLRKWRSGCEFIAMVQAAQSWQRNYLGGRVLLRFRHATAGRLLRQSKMYPVLVIVAVLLHHEALEMRRFKTITWSSRSRRQLPTDCRYYRFWCRRFCSGQSTQEPQDSTGDGRFAPSRSIKSSYFLQISIGFNKSFDLLWEQRAGGSNPSAPTIVNY
jgi:hypothetical protein